jgi:N-glycosylase/DNA lyase
MVQNLCLHFSPAVELDEESSEIRYHAFPPPSSLAAPETSAKLRSLGFGYRADFIQRTSQMLIEEHGNDENVFDFLDSLRTKSTEEAREQLLRFVGVGRKVADCVLLMGLDKVTVIC